MGTQSDGYTNLPTVAMLTTDQCGQRIPSRRWPALQHADQSGRVEGKNRRAEHQARRPNHSTRSAR